MDLKKIEQLIKLMKRYELKEVELKEKDSSIKLAYSHSSSEMKLPKQTIQPANNHVLDQSQKTPFKQLKNNNLQKVLSPFIGTFFRSPSPNAKCFVEKGVFVKKGTVLCIVEAMKLMNEIESPTDGIIQDILVENEHPVEYHQPLFLIAEQ
jgi:acetyl-CoA carboxylase biotin carboxyl carrier protein